MLVRRPKTPGAAKLRRVLRGEVNVTLSDLEKRFLEPAAQAPGFPFRGRIAWRAAAGSTAVGPHLGLTVELDSYRYHRSRHAWEQDRRREREAYARGDELRRYTYGDVFESPAPMLAELRALLTPAPSALPSPR